MHELRLLQQLFAALRKVGPLLWFDFRLDWRFLMALMVRNDSNEYLA